MTIYHHTDITRTNLIWMAGCLKPEHECEAPVEHPTGHRFSRAATLRRPMQDFPGVIWFTRHTSRPQCLEETVLMGEMGRRVAECCDKLPPGISKTDMIVWRRMAIGFPYPLAGVVPWPEYYGYHTAEGRDLNATAREYGDDPDDWYVSENTIDMMAATEIYASKRMRDVNLVRMPRDYIERVHAMVKSCREAKGRVYIPPSWMDPDEAAEMVRRAFPGIPVATDAELAAGKSF